MKPPQTRWKYVAEKSWQKNWEYIEKNKAKLVQIPVKSYNEEQAKQNVLQNE